ncbi:MAG TPA: BrnT family toxin, partial [Alphaproteobacteria bacterium]|nr:BrnT family toxin [Alphaproteobacteria bacterium]
MNFEWDEAKRLKTLRDRGLDFGSADQVFDGRPTLDSSTDRSGEARTLTIAEIDGKIVATVWTWRGDTIRIISMRRARIGE